MNKNFTKSDIPDIIDKFNKNIKKIIKILDAKIINNITLDTLKRRLYMVMKDSPIILLQHGGNTIYYYKDYIVNNSLDELFMKDLDYFIDVKNLNDNIKQDVNDKEIGELFNLTKLAWKTLNEKEKEYTTNIFKSLVSEYSKYSLIK